MRATKKVYEEVAKRCSSYAQTNQNAFSNQVEDGCTSCLTCQHFDRDEHCVLDLFDAIQKNL